MGVPAARVRLPDLDERVPHRRPSPSSTRPCTMIRWPCGSSACWRVRSWSSSPTRPSPSSGPVVSVSDRGSVTSARAGARRTVDRYAGYSRGIDHRVVVRACGYIGHFDTSVPPRDTGDVSPIQTVRRKGPDGQDRATQRWALDGQGSHGAPSGHLRASGRSRDADQPPDRVRDQGRQHPDRQLP